MNQSSEMFLQAAQRPLAFSWAFTKVYSRGLLQNPQLNPKYFPKVSISPFFLELRPEANLRHPHEGYYTTMEIVHVLYVKTLNLTAASLPYTLGKIFLPSPT